MSTTTNSSTAGKRDTAASGPIDFDQLPDSAMLRTRDAARFLGLAEGTLENWRTQRIGAPWLRVGTRTIRYRLGSLRQWQLRQLTK